MPELLWGIDLGGTKIEGAVLDGDLCVARKRIPTEADQGYEHIIDRIEHLIQEIRDEVGLAPTRIGIGTPGTRDPSTGLMRGCNTTALNGNPFLEDLQSRLKIEVRIANDANCFALAEAQMGAGKGHRVVFGVIMGTGVGGGIVVDGKVIEGMQGIAGEWGHNQLDPHGLRCYCGRVGCVETVLSGPFLEQFYETISRRKLAMREIVDAYRLEREGTKQDHEAFIVINHLILMFGMAIARIVNVLDPDAIILGGGVGSIEELRTLGADAAKRHIFNPEAKIRLLAPKLGDSAGVFGAALLT